MKRCILICILVSACGKGVGEPFPSNTPRENTATKEQEPRTPSQVAHEVTPDATITPPSIRKSREVVVYQRRNEQFAQSLEVEVVSRKTIRFALQKSGKCVATLEGTAVKRPEGDAESDADENGAGYFVEEYKYNKAECELSIRIDADVANRARIVATAGCATDCAFDETIMRKVH